MSPIVEAVSVVIPSLSDAELSALAAFISYEQMNRDPQFGPTVIVDDPLPLFAEVAA